MRNVAILHGAGETPKSFWFPYARKELEKRGYRVNIPPLPDANKPILSKWLPAALANKYDEETILIGHSAGCPLILSVLENIDISVKKAILVAGFIESLGTGTTNILQKVYDWEKIRGHSQEFIFINSDNDPWGCDDKQGRKMFDKLGGTLIIKHGEGHMGSDRFNQPYKEFPLLVRLVE